MKTRFNPIVKNDEKNNFQDELIFWCTWLIHDFKTQI